jgi:hypothetical protein
VGKGRATVALAEAGVNRSDWFGLKVHTPFRTPIVQNENGRYRLKQEFAQLNGLASEGYFRVAPPPYGLWLPSGRVPGPIGRPNRQLRSGRGDHRSLKRRRGAGKAKEHLGAFDALRRLIRAAEAGPAIGIVGHTRKPHAGERASGRALPNLLAGSHVLWRGAALRFCAAKRQR